MPDTANMYGFAPRPVARELPEQFTANAATSSENAQASVPGAIETETEKEGTEVSSSIFTPEQEAAVLVFGLEDTLAYAMRNARTIHDAKEELYLAALDLTLERHLWTPQFVASIQARGDFNDPGGLNDFDRTLTALSDFTLSQRLPYGGELSARIVNALVRDLENHVTSGESGNVILSADIPLLRGAGRVAYESRYAAERGLIYAVRTYERFRRSFLVSVAADFFSLQQSKASIRNTVTSYRARLRDWERADYINRMGRSRSVFEAPRAKSSLRQAEAALVSAKEQYATALDRLKILIAMPVDELLDVVEQDEDLASRTLDDLLPRIDQATAVEIALKYRLDLLTSADRVDDASRGIVVARNMVLPDLDLTASATFDSDPDRFNSLTFNTERASYQGGIELRMNDRKAERNAYRAALLGQRAAQRAHEQAVDTVKADVRRALRRIGQQENLRQIQALNVEENSFRLEAAREQFALGKSTNQDVVDAENDLLAARNDYARAVAEYRNAILRFRLDTGTLRVGDDGKWDAGANPSGSAKRDAEAGVRGPAGG